MKYDYRPNSGTKYYMKYDYRPNSGRDDWDLECRHKCSMAITDKDTPFRVFMHYSDPEAGGDPITVFGCAKEGLFYNYSDRLVGEGWYKGWEIAKEKKITPNTARFFECVLNTYHGVTDVNLQHVMLGVNRSNGYDYLIFGYTYTEKE